MQVCYSELYMRVLLSNGRRLGPNGKFATGRFFIPSVFVPLHLNICFSNGRGLGPVLILSSHGFNS